MCRETTDLSLSNNRGTISPLETVYEDYSYTVSNGEIKSRNFSRNIPATLNSNLCKI